MPETTVIETHRKLLAKHTERYQQQMPTMHSEPLTYACAGAILLVTREAFAVCTAHPVDTFSVGVTGCVQAVIYVCTISVAIFTF